MNQPIMFLEQHNKTKLVPAFFFYLLELLWPLQSLCIIKELTKLFYLHCSCRKEVQINRKVSNKGEFKSDQEYFAKYIRKSWKPQK